MGRQGRPGEGEACAPEEEDGCRRGWHEARRHERAGGAGAARRGAHALAGEGEGQKEPPAARIAGSRRSECEGLGFTSLSLALSSVSYAAPTPAHTQPADLCQLAGTRVSRAPPLGTDTHSDPATPGRFTRSCGAGRAGLPGQPCPARETQTLLSACLLLPHPQEQVQTAGWGGGW